MSRANRAARAAGTGFLTLLLGFVTVTLVHAAKPVAAFSLEHAVAGVPSVGMPLEVQVTLRPQASIGDVTVQASADAGLEVNPADAVLQAVSATQDAPAEWSVTVVPMQEGLLYLKLYAEGEINGSRQGRSLMVPIRVGAPKDGDSTAKRFESERLENDPPGPGEQGERLIRLPAQERR